MVSSEINRLQNPAKIAQKSSGAGHNRDSLGKLGSKRPPRCAKPNTSRFSSTLLNLPASSINLRLLLELGRPRVTFLHYPAEGRGIEIFIFKLGRGALWPSLAVDPSYLGGCGCGGCSGDGVELLKDSLGTEDFGGKRSYFLTGLGALGTHLTKGFMRTCSV